MRLSNLCYLYQWDFQKGFFVYSETGILQKHKRAYLSSPACGDRKECKKCNGFRVACVRHVLHMLWLASFRFKVMNVFGSTREPPESTKIDSGIRSGSSTFPHIEYLQYSQFLGTWVCQKSSTICKITYGVSEPSILRKKTPESL